MYIDSNLQAISPFISHVQSDGSQIGGIDPLDYGATPIPGMPRALLLRTSGNSDKTGKQYPAWLWSTAPRPILPNTGRFQMSYDFRIGGNLQGANVFETDTILIAVCADGVKRKFNLSLQRHIATGQIDIGNWTDTTLRAGALSQNTKHKVVIYYSFDLTKNVCSVLAYSCDGIPQSVPANLQNMPATQSTWAVGAIPQVQLGSLPNGLPWQVKLSKLRYRWF
ncbi:MAG TPA: hypothetical protein VK574_07610 [Terracidiphilus sp.]|nr:hypothetical protein [Terracidiphilus sp.]